MLPKREPTIEASSPRPRSARSRASPAARPASRPITWPRPCGPGTRRGRPPATWLSGASGPSSSARPRPTPWWSMPCWSSGAPWPRWPCWCSGSARPTRFRWPKKTIRSTTWRWIGCRTCGTTSTTAKPPAAARRSSAGPWPASSSITWRPTPRRIGRFRSSSWPAKNRPAARRRATRSTIFTAPPTKA